MMAQLKLPVEAVNIQDVCDYLRYRSDVQLINILNPDFYYLGSIRGSLKIPYEELENRLDEIDREKEIITYGAHEDCVSSSLAAEKLLFHGFKARSYEGGIREWKENGLPVE
jgi:rhodanese-related sulfurtransferase